MHDGDLNKYRANDYSPEFESHVKKALTTWQQQLMTTLFRLVPTKLPGGSGTSLQSSSRYFSKIIRWKLLQVGDVGDIVLETFLVGATMADSGNLEEHAKQEAIVLEVLKDSLKALFKTVGHGAEFCGDFAKWNKSTPQADCTSRTNSVKPTAPKGRDGSPCRPSPKPSGASTSTRDTLPHRLRPQSPNNPPPQTPARKQQYTHLSTVDGKPTSPSSSNRNDTVGGPSNHRTVRTRTRQQSLRTRIFGRLCSGIERRRPAE